jgi:hypothetical protein
LSRQYDALDAPQLAEEFVIPRILHRDYLRLSV